MFHRPGAVGPGEEAGDLGDPVVAGDHADRRCGWGTVVGSAALDHEMASGATGHLGQV